MEKSATIGTPVRWACSLPKKPLSWSDQLPTYKLVVGGVWARAPSPFSFSRSLCRDPTPPSKTLPYNIDSQWAILDALDPGPAGGEGQRLPGAVPAHRGGLPIVFSVTDKTTFEHVDCFHQLILRVKDRESFPMILLVKRSI